MLVNKLWWQNFRASIGHPLLMEPSKFPHWTRFQKSFFPTRLQSKNLYERMEKSFALCRDKIIENMQKRFGLSMWTKSLSRWWRITGRIREVWTDRLRSTGRKDHLTHKQELERKQVCIERARTFDGGSLYEDRRGQMVASYPRVGTYEDRESDCGIVPPPIWRAVYSR